MRMSLWLRCAGLLLVGVVGASSAQSYRSMTTGTPRASGQYYYTQPTPVAPPGCATPVAPPVHGQPVPYTAPSPMPSAPYRAPSAMPSTPSTATPPAPYTPGSLPPGATSPAPGAAVAPPTATPAVPGAAAAAASAAAAGSAAESRGESGSEALASAAPQMIGDLIGGGLATRYSSGSSYYRSSTGVRVPVVTQSGVKIADNESPRPLDRAFATYNYYNSTGVGAGAFTGLHRGLIGFEKTALEGDASFGMRLPYLWDDNGAGLDGIGMLSVIGKYAFYNDCETGNLASGGLSVAIPLGNSFKLGDGTDLNSVLLQPWAGFIYGVDELYAHGFTSLIIPTQSNDVLLYTADVGVGYRLFQSDNGDFLRAIIPTIEGHLNTPLNNAGRTEQVYFPTLISITAGVHIGMGSGCWFTLAGGVPITGPNLYDFEAMAQFNYRF